MTTATPTSIFSPNAQYLLCTRGYAHKGPNHPICSHCNVRHEDPEDVVSRVGMYKNEYIKLLEQNLFAPNSPTWFNLPCDDCKQTKVQGTCSACFKFDVQDTMDSILDVTRKAGLVLKAGGGTGFVFSEIRPEGANVNSTHRHALGPLGVMRIYQTLAKEITQGGQRNAAQMAILHCDHPDIMKFVESKVEHPELLDTFNISVACTDEFMDQALNGKGPAIQVFKQMINNAWENGDPGCYFIDTAEKGNPTPWLGKLTGTNPCLAGSTRMLTKQGLIPIDQMDTREFWTPGGWSLGTAWSTGQKDVVQVILSNGQRITTTPDHKFVVGEMKLEADELLDERLEPFLGDGTWEGNDDWKGNDLIRLGFLMGDGHRHKSGGMYANIGRKDKDVDELFKQYKLHGDRKRYIGVNDLFTLDVADEFGLILSPLPERSLPEKTFKLSPRALKLFLRGLFSANGTAHRTVARVSLKSTSLGLVTEVQQLLLALGFRPYITTNKPTMVRWQNGEYLSKQSYDLNIVGSELKKFRVEIGFVQEYKQDRLFRINVGEPTRRLKPTVIAIEPLNNEVVYDFNVSDPTHVGWANGFAVTNCGEVPLLDNEPCNLGSINLGKFVINDGKDVDWDHLEEVTRTAIQYLDDILDINEFPTPEIDAAARLTRKLGLGVMGWADMLALMKIPYGSDQSIQLGANVMQFINAHAQAASQRLGMEKDPAPCFIDRIVDATPSDTPTEGPPLFAQRNATVTCIAPTGTIAILMGASGGIEPHFKLEWDRKTGEGHVMTERLTDYLDLDGFVPLTAHEIPADQQIWMQSAFQDHVDLAVSKTINLPNDASPKQISDAYLLAWKSGCKGVTVFRDGSRDEQVLTDVGGHTRDRANAFIHVGPLPTPDQEQPKFKDWVDDLRATEKGSVRHKLPATRKAINHRFQVGEQEGYLSFGLYEDGTPGELFLNASQQGSTIRGLLDGIGILTSLALQYGVPVNVLVRKFRRMTFEPQGMTQNPNIPTATSILDYVGHFMEKEFTKPTISLAEPEKYGDEPTGFIDLTQNGNGDTCPDCGNGVMYSEGCMKCSSGCGWTKC